MIKAPVKEAVEYENKDEKDTPSRMKKPLKQR